MERTFRSQLVERPPVGHQPALHLAKDGTCLVILLRPQRGGHVLFEPIEMFADDPSDLLVARGARPEVVRWP